MKPGDGRTCFLHVGTGKTGSSAIQYVLTKTHDELLEAGLLYPDASRNFHAVLAGKPTAGNAINVAVALHAGDIADALKLIRPYSRRPEHLVLSCEGLSNVSAAALDQFAEGLIGLGYSLKCLVLFRPQIERVVSSYLQQVKADKALVRTSLETFANRIAGPQIERGLDWYARANKLEAAFGKPNLTVLWYPSLRRRGLDAVPAAALEWLGAPSLNRLHGTTSSPLVNPTPSQEALLVLQEVNASGLGGKHFADLFLKTAQERGITGTKVALSRPQALRIYAATLESNRRLLQEYCPDLNPAKELPAPEFDEEYQAPLDTDALTALRAIAKKILGPRHKDVLSKVKAAPAHRETPKDGERPKCVIHVGMHKTGSTSIQKSLLGFEDDRFVYADLGNYGNHSVPIYSLFSHRPEQHHIHRSAGRNAAEAKQYVANVRANLERELARAGGRTLIISGEDITVLRAADLAKLHEYFKERVDDLRIVAYVRAPAALMASRFQQLVKGGTLAALDFDRIYRSYESLLAKFDDVFGRDKVELWKFDHAAFPNGDVVQDFCTRLGIDLPKNRIVRMNESISRQAVSLLYCYSKSVRGRESKIRAPEAIRLGEAIAGDKFRFSPQLVQSVLDEQKTDIAWIEQRLGASLQENLGPEKPGDIRDESDLLRPEPEAVSRLLKILGRRAPEGVKGETTEEVAQLVAAWRKTLSRRDLRRENRPDIKRWLSRREGQGKFRHRRGDRSAGFLTRVAAMLRYAYRRIAPQTR